MRAGINRAGEPVEGRLRWITLRQQLVTPPFRLKLLGFLPDTRLFVKHPPLQFAEESFPREFLFGNFEGFLDIVVKDLDFHVSCLSTFPGDACLGLLSCQQAPDSVAAVYHDPLSSSHGL